MWSHGCSKSNVWIATVARMARGDTGTDWDMRLASLQRIQALSGDGEPFARLAGHLRDANFRAAGIDAPFSVPEAYVPGGSHAALLATVGQIEPPERRRPFPDGSQFVQTIAAHAPLERILPKVYRETERAWSGRGVNVRSTLWAGARGGAAMTSACITLLHRARVAVWPWSQATTSGLVVEAFPAAQLQAWGLPHEGYSKRDQSSRHCRIRIADDVGRRVRLGTYDSILREEADALDALLCAFAGIAVSEGRVLGHAGAASTSEGWIAVHS